MQALFFRDGFVEIEQDPRHRHTPVIALTANAFGEDRAACLDAGMNDHVGKPVDPVLLYTTLLRREYWQAIDLPVEVIERIELWWDSQGIPDWFLVTKLPLFDKRRRVQGVMGTLRRPDEAERRLPVFQTVAQAVEITFFREMAPLSRFTLESRVVCWDERYCYIQHEFLQNGKLCASAMIRVVFLKAGERLPMAEVIQLLGIDLLSPPFPEQIAAWAAVFEIKKNKQR